MACYRPIHGYRDSGGSLVFSARKGADVELTVSCGQCIGCRIARARMWQLRCMHEASLWERNCFVTLTYDALHLPPFGTLQYRDVQLFLKRLRKAVGRFRFFLVGEYGEELFRPHYHICFFGLWFSDARPVSALYPGKHPEWSSSILESTWGKGFTHITELNSTTAGYAARYCFKKIGGDRAKSHYCVVDDDGVCHWLLPEFARMSLRPGIGASWYEKYSGDVHTHDYCVADGTEFPVPRYYDVLLSRRDPDRLLELKEAREARAIPFMPDNSFDRLVVKEEVATSKASQYVRRFENG